MNVIEQNVILHGIKFDNLIQVEETAVLNLKIVHEYSELRNEEGVRGEMIYYSLRK